MLDAARSAVTSGRDAADRGEGGEDVREHSGRRWSRPFLVGLAVSAGFLWLTLRRVDLAAVGTAVAGVSLPVLSLALVTRGIAFLSMGLRSRVTTALERDVSLRVLTLSHLLGYTGNNVLPLRLGELLRVDFVARRAGLSRSFLVGTVAVERLLDSVVLVVVFAATVPLAVGGASWAGAFPALATATVLALLTAMVLARWRFLLPSLLERTIRPLSPGLAGSLRGRAEEVARGLSTLSSARWLPSAVGATVLYWACALGSVQIIVAAFGLAMPWWGPSLILSLTALGTALPSSPGFVGTYHYFSALGVSTLGADPSTAASFALVAHAMAVAPYTVVGLAVFPGSLREWTKKN